jgi:hypothetical protein
MSITNRALLSNMALLRKLLSSSSGQCLPSKDFALYSVELGVYFWNNANISNSSMPTFIIFRSGKVHQTLRGADPRGLTSAVESAVKIAATMKQNYSYGSVGHTLGGSARPSQSLQQPLMWRWNIKAWLTAIYTFLGLYFISLFSVSETPIFARRCL